MKLIIVFCMFIYMLTPTLSMNIANNAKGVCLLDYHTGKVLYARNENSKMYIASTTKIMTLILIYEALRNNKISYDDILTTSLYASSMGGSQIYLKENEKMSVHDLIKSIAIGSANDACVVLAERIAGSHTNFVSLMNDKVRVMKLKNTHFMNCTGLHDDNHYSSAYDLALMAKYLIHIGGNELLEITSLYDAYIRNDSNNPFWLVNTNKLLKQYDGIDGLKTGYTKKAGYCLVATGKRDGLRLIGVLLNEENAKVRNKEMIELFDYGYSLYSKKVLYKKEDIVDSISIYNSDKTKVNIYPSEDIIYYTNSDNIPQYDISIINQKAPLSSNDIVGYLILNEQEYPLIVLEGINVLKYKDKVIKYIEYLFL